VGAGRLATVVGVTMLAGFKDAVPRSLIASDFDGTLSPIVADPMAARPVPGVISTLTRLAEQGAQVAIVTGRDAMTVLELGGFDRIPGVVVSGLHGAETWRDGHLQTIAEPAGLQELRSLLPPLLPADVWLEDKRLSLVLHARRSSNPAQRLAELERTVPALVARHGLEAHPGKLVLEIRIPGLSKATALEQLLNPQLEAALFAGDDLGDLPAVAAVSGWGVTHARRALTVAVGEVAELGARTDLHFDSPVAFAAGLQQLAG
jgi:trehalose 6-phosphate phosphatase